MRKKIYSDELTRWVDSQIPHEIICSMLKNAWNAFGIYELVKEGIKLERKRNLITKSSQLDEAKPDLHLCYRCGHMHK